MSKTSLSKCARCDSRSVAALPRGDPSISGSSSGGQCHEAPPMVPNPKGARRRTCEGSNGTGSSESIVGCLYISADYSRAVGPRWLISAVARIYRPGAKADCCLILERPQGIRKSSALRTLAGEYFTDELADLGSKDAAMQTRGVWIIELSELDSLTHSEVARIKAFMSRTTDRFGPPYGMRLVESPRQCIFAGTVNHSTYLRDATGS